MEYTIREYRPSDRDFLLESHRTVYASEYGYNDRFYEFASKTIEDFLAVTKWDKEAIWIAEADGAPVGSLALIRPEPESPQLGQLRWFLVRPAYRRYGIGRALMEKALEHATAWGCDHIFLWTASNLDNALAFYHRYGFRETQRIEEPDWSDELLYELKLERDLPKPETHH